MSCIYISISTSYTDFLRFSMYMSTIHDIDQADRERESYRPVIDHQQQQQQHTNTSSCKCQKKNHWACLNTLMWEFASMCVYFLKNFPDCISVWVVYVCFLSLFLHSVCIWYTWNANNIFSMFGSLCMRVCMCVVFLEFMNSERTLEATHPVPSC